MAMSDPVCPALNARVSISISQSKRIADAMHKSWILGEGKEGLNFLLLLLLLFLLLLSLLDEVILIILHRYIGNDRCVVSERENNTVGHHIQQE